MTYGFKISPKPPEERQYRREELKTPLYLNGFVSTTGPEPRSAFAFDSSLNAEFLENTVRPGLCFVSLLA